ncbi:TPA: IS66 family transposase [Escherichia coli]
MVYALFHRVELSRFLEDGAVSLDNNVCERAIMYDLEQASLS